MTQLDFGERPVPGSQPVPLDALLRSRLLVQANSGGGKSHLLRALLEATHGRVLQLVLDPEGEFATLRERYSYVLAGEQGDIPAHPSIARVMCRRLVEAQASAIISLYDLSAHERREFVKLFLTELMALPRTLWRPTLVVLDEAHAYCPERGHGEAQSTDAVITLCSQGRKRSFAAVLATQRISKLHKDAAAELGNKLIGRTGLDVDLKRAGDELGMDKDGRLTLRELQPGEFYAFGPAFGTGVSRVTAPRVRTSHGQQSSVSALTPPASSDVQTLLAKIGDLPALAKADQAEVVTLRARVVELERERKQRAPIAPLIDVEAVRLDAAVVTRGECARESRERIAGVRMKVNALVDILADVKSALSQWTDALGLEVHAAAPSVPPFARPVTMPREVVQDSGPSGVTLTTFPPIATPSGSPSKPVPITNTMKRMLGVLVQLKALGVVEVTKQTLAGWAGVSHTTGTFSNQMRALRDAGYVEFAGHVMRLTPLGAAHAPAEPLYTSLAELHETWASKFSATVARMFRALLVMSGPSMHPVSKDALARACGVSHTTGTFSNHLRELRNPGVIEDVDKQHVRMTALVYPVGLR